MMETNSIVRRLEYWQERAKKLEMQMDALRALTGAAVDSDFAASIYSVMDAYTVAVSELVGDESEWLNWFMYECAFGREPLEVTLKNGKTLKVRTLRQLARVIRS